MLTSKQLTQKIAGIRKSTAALRESVHEVLCNAAAHAYVHGDVTAYTRLLDATSGMNRKLIAKWVHDYGFAILQKDGSFKLNATARKNADFKDGIAVVAYLMDEVRPWYADEASAAEIARELDVAARIKALASQIKNAANKNTAVRIDGRGINEAMAMLKEAILSEVDAPKTVDTAQRIAA